MLRHTSISKTNHKRSPEPATEAQANAPSNLVRHFTQFDLAKRWRVSPRTLERWRWLRQGPAYLKLGGSVVYRMEDVESFEAAQLCDVAAAIAPASCVAGR